MPGMLTGKQQWRRQSTSSRRSNHDFIYSERDNFKPFNGGRSLSDNSIHSKVPNMVNIGKPYATTSDLLEAKRDIFGKKKKSVIFSARVHVVLIPNISEYYAAGLAPALWWTEEDYKEFKMDALQEVQEFMNASNMRDTKEAIRIMYQLADEEADKLMIQQQQEKETTPITTNKYVNNNNNNNTYILEKEQGREESKESFSSRSDSCLENTKHVEFKLLSQNNRAHSFSEENNNDISNSSHPIFRSKTDLDLINDHIRKETGGNESIENHRAVLHRLLSTHLQYSRMDARNSDPIHPLALICS